MCASIINLAKQLKMFTKRTNTENLCAWMLCRCLNRSSPSIFMETVISDRIGESMPPRCGCLARFEIVRFSIALDVTVRTENPLFPYPFYLQHDMGHKFSTIRPSYPHIHVILLSPYALTPLTPYPSISSPPYLPIPSSHIAMYCNIAMYSDITMLSEMAMYRNTAM